MTAPRTLESSSFVARRSSFRSARRRHHSADLFFRCALALMSTCKHVCSKYSEMTPVALTIYRQAKQGNSFCQKREPRVSLTSGRAAHGVSLRMYGTISRTQVSDGIRICIRDSHSRMETQWPGLRSFLPKGASGSQRL